MALIFYMKENEASNNIKEELSDLIGEENIIRISGNSIVDFEPVKYIPSEKLDWRSKKEYIIVLSSHKSSSGIASLTVHCPGNWGKADFGGEEKTLSIAYASKMLVVLLEMSKRADIDVSYEADHHGPTINYPIMFVELGNPLWNSKKYARVIAESVVEVIDSSKSYEAYLGFGGNHYMAKQTRLAKEKEIAFSHLLPKHNADYLDEDLFKQAVEKNVESIEGIIMDKKGLRKEHRDFILKKSNEFGLEVSIV